MHLGEMKLLDATEERRLARRWRRTRDPRIAERLVRAHLRLVMMIARRYRFSGHDLRELFQVGALGLLSALRKYDPGRGVRLSTYAASWIHARILEFLWNNRRLVRAAPSVRSRARRPGATPRQLEAAVALRRHLRTTERDLDLPLMAPDEQRPDALVEAAELRARLRAAVDRFAGRLPERDRAILDARLRAEEPVTLAALGVRFGISRERARQLERGLVERLRRHVAAELRP